MIVNALRGYDFDEGASVSVIPIAHKKRPRRRGLRNSARVQKHAKKEKQKKLSARSVADTKPAYFRVRR